MALSQILGESPHLLAFGVARRDLARLHDVHVRHGRAPHEPLALRESLRFNDAALGERLGSHLPDGALGSLSHHPRVRALIGRGWGLDITVLHEVLLDVVGASFETETVQFIHDATEAVERVDREVCDLAFLLNATRIDDLVSVVDSGLTMPQKSTFFYPKPATGLVLNRLT